MKVTIKENIVLNTIDNITNMEKISASIEEITDNCELSLRGLKIVVGNLIKKELLEVTEIPSMQGLKKVFELSEEGKNAINTSFNFEGFKSDIKQIKATKVSLLGEKKFLEFIEGEKKTIEELVKNEFRRDLISRVKNIFLGGFNNFEIDFVSKSITIPENTTGLHSCMKNVDELILTTEEKEALRNYRDIGGFIAYARYINIVDNYIKQYIDCFNGESFFSRANHYLKDFLITNDGGIYRDRNFNLIKVNNDLRLAYDFFKKFKDTIEIHDNFFKNSISRNREYDFICQLILRGDNVEFIGKHIMLTNGYKEKIYNDKEV